MDHEEGTAVVNGPTLVFRRRIGSAEGNLPAARGIASAMVNGTRLRTGVHNERLAPHVQGNLEREVSGMALLVVPFVCAE